MTPQERHEILSRKMPASEVGKRIEEINTPLPELDWVSDGVNIFLANAMKYLMPSQWAALADALRERCPTPPTQTVEEGKEGEARLRWVLLRDYLPNEDEEIVVRRVGMKNSYCVVVRRDIKLRDTNLDALYGYTSDPDIEWLEEYIPAAPPAPSSEQVEKEGWRPDEFEEWVNKLGETLYRSGAGRNMREEFRSAGDWLWEVVIEDFLNQQLSTLTQRLADSQKEAGEKWIIAKDNPPYDWQKVIVAWHDAGYGYTGAAVYRKEFNGFNLMQAPDQPSSGGIMLTGEGLMWRPLPDFPQSKYDELVLAKYPIQSQPK